ncbi:xin actin-binding repeat-containing protein 1 [Varanus komodoensis]|uniref:Xin actin binding repeat containing 1 n=1 Tax=Varanus komodoensis TaxID=61221 RepID=A0A8D2LH38_VARKO|nr:xin actin-binding repeat-containing protein 1 [Varanus komodoensis]
MAEAPNEKSSSPNVKKAEEALPSGQHPSPAPASGPGSQDPNPQPLPPPKESFSKFYQQRQVNELKRLYRHMHPELRKNLEEAVTEDLAEMLSTDDPHAQTSGAAEAVLPGEVQSMRWIFENWTLDAIGDHQAAKKLAEEEDIPSGDVKSRSMRFESQLTNGEGAPPAGKASERERAKGDVHTARWLFETQPLDSLNKIYLDETDVQEAVLKEPVQSGDVKGAAQLFETHSLDALGRCSSVEERNILQLKSEIQELKGDVKKTIKLFQTEPLCAIRDETGNIHEIKSVCREEIQSNAVKTARWLFETQPLDTINKDPSKVQVIRGISLEEAARGNVSGTKWLFETQPLDAIRELTVEEADFKASPDLIQGADVSKQCQLFETQPLDTLKGDASDSTPAREEVVKGDVKSTLWLFETQPMEVLKDNFEVGHLKKVELSDEEKGAVKQTKHVFETCPLDSISRSPPEGFSATNGQQTEKGDVKAFKSLFETLPLDCIRQVSTEEAVQQGEEIPPGNVRASQALFETTPLYAIKDCQGNFHKVTSVSREEEVMGGDVKNYKWMFETKPLDQFDDGTQKVDVIRGITKQEVVAGDVKTARWLFETQPIDVIHSQVNPKEQDASERRDVSQGGAVRTCRWLFETHPIDALYEKDEKKLDREEPVPRTDVKSCTWMFETQPLDSLKGQEEQYLQVSKAFCPAEFQGVDVKTVRHLFETEPLINHTTGGKDSKEVCRYSSRVEIQSGEVSRVKEFFEAKPLDSTDKTTQAMKATDLPPGGNIEPGAVHKFSWLFENFPMDTLKSTLGGIQEIPPEKDIQGGDVGGKRFIFETYSLGQIHDEENEMQIKKIQEETMNKSSVKSCTMLFETQPLYAIQDRDGGYHEVTSVKKDEIMKGDVKGARWQFETKPLDQIQKNEEVFVIRAVTQEDFKTGDVQAARWRFETEPLDSIADEKKPILRTVDDVQKGDVHSNKQLFESEQLSQKKYVRMVSVSDVQQGDVRTSTWLFENQPIDSLKGDSESASGLSLVQRENIHKGDVKRCTWLFETQPMDTLKDTDVSASAEPPEVVPQVNVKSTTWLFESTPLDKLSTSPYCTETEARQRALTYTLEVLFAHQAIQHGGILIEANDTESVKMAKYQLGCQGAPEILKEEVMGGNLQRILLQLLQRTNVEAQGVLVQEEEDGNLKISPVQLLDPSKAEKSQPVLQDDVARTLQDFLSQADASLKKGIIMQETETGSVKMAVYTLRCVARQDGLVKGDVKSTIGNLLASSQEHRPAATIRREDNERGNVQLYTSCIEKGDLDYLKNLHREMEIESLVSSQAKEEPLKTPHEGAAPAQVQQEKVVTAADVIRGSSSDAKRVCLCASKEGSLEREAGHASDSGPTTPCLVPSPPAGTAAGHAVAGKAQPATQAVPKEQEGSRSPVREESITPSSRAGEMPQGAAQPQPPSPGSELHAAMQSLRLVTAEAKSLQHQVRSKLQKSAEDPPLTAPAAQPQAVALQATAHNKRLADPGPPQAGSGTVVRVQEAGRESGASVPWKSAASHTQAGAPPAACCDDCFAPRAGVSIKDGLYTAKPVKPYVNPFLESEFKEHSVPEERAQDPVVGGDVRTALSALQNAAAEQRRAEKEDVVRGNLKAALESLEKSNVNVSKGDFKAAMIYRNAGQSQSMCRKKSEAQSVSDQAAAVVATGSRALNDFPPPSPASLVRPEGHTPPAKEREEDAVGCPPPGPPHIPKTLPPAPAKPSDPRPMEKPQHPHKPEAPPRKKPVPPPKPEFLLKEGLSCQPAGCSKRPLGKAAPPPRPSKPPSVVEQNKPRTPLQVAEEKYRAKKEASSAEGASRMPSAEASENGLAGCEGGNCQPSKEIQRFPCQGESRCMSPGGQHSLSSPGCHADPAPLGGQRKPYLSAKCHANVLKKGTVTVQASSSKRESAGLPRASVLKDEQRSPKAQEAFSEAARSASSSLQSKQFPKQQQCVPNKDFRDPETKTEQSTERDEPVVVMREKTCRETEDERRERLSVHKEEIMKGNVKEAMEIFENLRKQEALQEILTRVKEFEEETSKVDVKALRSLFENVPDWVVHHKVRQPKAPRVEKAEQMKDVKEDADSVSSVELAFEDLERASAEILHLKEQTLSRLLDIEEAIRKALCSISNLKSESDIAGLSGLLKESIGDSQSLAAGNNIRRISIVSSKAQQEGGTQNSPWEGERGPEKQELPRVELSVPHIIQPRVSSPSSPSYISIQSAARKTSESPKAANSSSSNSREIATERELVAQDIFSAMPHKTMRPDGCNVSFCTGEQEVIQMKKGASLIKQQHLSSPEHLQHPTGSHGDKERDAPFTVSLCALSPSNPRRQKSILELQTSQDGSKLYGATRTVTEQYEEVDEFGNKIITSSTTVTKQSETQTSSTCDMVSCPTRYEVTASPVLHRYLNSPVDFQSNHEHQDTGVVFVTFSNSKPAKK